MATARSGSSRSAAGSRATSRSASSRCSTRTCAAHRRPALGLFLPDQRLDHQLRELFRRRAQRKDHLGQAGRLDAQVHHRVRRHHRRPPGLCLGARELSMPNRLASATSPYLLQHADNPVDWYPWGPEAFARPPAPGTCRSSCRIGYSTCHWCHVMAHESFEDPAIAALLNEHFVSIKVDREERPDVDRVYMSYVQALTGQGGWPLCAWLTPDLKPFYGGTYFPPEDRHGRAGLPDDPAGHRQGVARGPPAAYRRVRASRGSLRERAEERSAPAEGSVGPSAEAAGAAFEKAYQYYAESFDPRQRRLRRRAQVSRGRQPGLPPALRRAPGARRARRESRPPAWSPPRCGNGARAESTTRSAAVSTATPWTGNGSFRISRRCSTTRRRSPGQRARRLAGHGRRAPRLARGGHPRLRAAGPDGARGWILFGGGRGFARGAVGSQHRGRLLCVDDGGGGARARRRRPVRLRAFWRPRRGQRAP